MCKMSTIIAPLLLLLLLFCSAARAQLTARDFSSYSEEHSNRMYAYCGSSYCVPSSTFISQFISSGDYPHVTPVAGSIAGTPEVTTFASDVTAAADNAHIMTDEHIFGYVVTDPADQAIIVCFRGSLLLSNWITDLKFFPQDTTYCPDNQAKGGPGCISFRSHIGFTEAWAWVQDDVKALVKQALVKYPRGLIHVTGHSLGGAIALLAGVSLYQNFPNNFGSMYTFGQPRTADEPLFSWIRSKNINYFRIVSEMDPVAHIPQYVNLDHGGVDVWYPGGVQTGNQKSVCPQVWEQWQYCSESPMTGICKVSYLCIIQNVADHLDYFSGIVFNCAKKGFAYLMPIPKVYFSVTSPSPRLSNMPPGMIFLDSPYSRGLTSIPDNSSYYDTLDFTGPVATVPTGAEPSHQASQLPGTEKSASSNGMLVPVLLSVLGVAVVFAGGFCCLRVLKGKQKEQQSAQGGKPRSSGQMRSGSGSGSTRGGQQLTEMTAHVKAIHVDSNPSSQSSSPRPAHHGAGAQPQSMV